MGTSLNVLVSLSFTQPDSTFPQTQLSIHLCIASHFALPDADLSACCSFVCAAFLDKGLLKACGKAAVLACHCTGSGLRQKWRNTGFLCFLPGFPLPFESRLICCHSRVHSLLLWRLDCIAGLPGRASQCCCLQNERAKGTLEAPNEQMSVLQPITTTQALRELLL